MAVELRKGQKVNLRKKRSEALGEILINLNWSQPQPKSLKTLFFLAPQVRVKPTTFSNFKLSIRARQKVWMLLFGYKKK